jgi:hypothetical protein
VNVVWNVFINDAFYNRRNAYTEWFIGQITSKDGTGFCSVPARCDDTRWPSTTPCDAPSNLAPSTTSNCADCTFSRRILDHSYRETERDQITTMYTYTHIHTRSYLCCIS